jgi:O-antigen/teichoic acid export membrane protein
MNFILNRVHRSAAAWSFFATLLRVGANIFVLPFILRQLPAEQFGVWQVFIGIGGLTALLDFGFENTITRMTSYAWGGASKFVAFGIHLDEAAAKDRPPNLPLLNDLIATVRAYYFYAGLAVLALLVIGGEGWIWFVTRHLEGANSVRLAWLVFAAGCWLNFIVGRWPALLSGIGAVREAQVASILSLIVYYIVVSAMLFAGWGIWAMVLASVIMGFVARHYGKRFFVERAGLPGGLPRARFHRDIFLTTWPNAWRSGLVSLGSFFTVQANTLICSLFLSLTVTGAYGLAFQLVNLLFSLCYVWLTVKLPVINTLRVQGRNAEITELFARRLRLSLLSYLAGAVVIVFAAPVVLHWLKSNTSLIAVGPLSALVFIRFLELHQSLYAVLVQTENHNPFVKPSLISGVAIVAVSLGLMYFWGNSLGVWGLLLSTGLVQLAYNDWWPVLRGVRGLGWKPRVFLVHHYLRPKAWLELF